MATGQPIRTSYRRRCAMTCPFCREIFIRPKFLPCVHTVCLKCLEILASRNGAPATFFLCPQCNKDTAVPPGGVSEFKDNFYLSEQDLERERARRPCSVHNNVFMDQYCSDCHVPMCVRCAVTRHHKHTAKDLHVAVLESRPEDKVGADEAAAQLRDKIAREKRILALKTSVEGVIYRKHAELVAMANKYRDDMLAALDTVSIDFSSGGDGVKGKDQRQIGGQKNQK